MNTRFTRHLDPAAIKAKKDHVDSLKANINHLKALIQEPHPNMITVRSLMSSFGLSMPIPDDIFYMARQTDL
jgi:hypothetical protein